MATVRNEVIERQEYPDLFQTKTFGPFNAPSGNIPLYLTDQRTFIDGILVSLTTAGSEASPQVSLWYATDGQTMAAAVTAGQRLSPDVLIGTQATALAPDVADDVRPESIVDGVPANSRIFIRAQGTSTAVTGLMWCLRERNRIA